ncbi:hypothetical protein jhhlp_008077 [Lomentospora prolificans]|uniref:Protamine P1 n=1 Tax=Lomentospora prolificans TaxID=41688 RepID=A0A2N3MZH1_9PEZI|nr:hypothetical protein jhhlp_008077 [Lomentospora prolificans]
MRTTRTAGLCQRDSTPLVSLTTLASQPSIGVQSSTKRTPAHRHSSVSKEKLSNSKAPHDTNCATDTSAESEDPITAMKPEEEPKSSRRSISSAKLNLSSGSQAIKTQRMTIQTSEEDELSPRLPGATQPACDGALSIPSTDVQMQEAGKAVARPTAEDSGETETQHPQLTGIEGPAEGTSETSETSTDTAVEDVQTENRAGIEIEEASMDVSSEAIGHNSFQVRDTSTTLVEDTTDDITPGEGHSLEPEPKDDVQHTDLSILPCLEASEHVDSKSPVRQPVDKAVPSPRIPRRSRRRRSRGSRIRTKTPDKRLIPEDQSPWMEEPIQPIIGQDIRENTQANDQEIVQEIVHENSQENTQDDPIRLVQENVEENIQSEGGNILCGVAAQVAEPASQSILIPAEAQSPWMESPTLLQTNVRSPVEDSTQPSLTPPREVLAERQPVAGTSPSSDFSNQAFLIRSFSSFMTPPTKPQFATVPDCSGRLPQTPSLLRAALENPWQTNSRPKKRVSWAPLPDEDSSETAETRSSSSRSHFSRTSPPPADPIPDQVEGSGEAFTNHFVSVKRRADPVRQRLLPSASQQVQGSPQTDAMAQAFVVADHIIPQIEIKGDLELKEDKENVQQEPADDVDAVLDNLGDFLDAWDVDTDLEKSRTSLGSHGHGPSSSSILLDMDFGGW